MADIRKLSSTSNLVRFTLKHSTTGQGLTGLSSASSGLIISTIADNEATPTAYTVAGSTIESITTLGTYAAPTATKCRFKEVDATNHKGLYEFQFINDRFSVANAKRLVISVTGATNLSDTDYEIQLVAYDPHDAVRMGLTALPNAAAEAAGGLYTRGTGAGQIAQDANGNIRANLDTIKTQTVTCAAGVTVYANVGTAAADTAQTGDAYAVVNHASYGNAQLVRATTPANTLDVSATGEAGLDFNNIKQAAAPTTLTNITVPTVSTLTGHTAQTGDCYAIVNSGTYGNSALNTKLGTPAGASISADIDALPTAVENADTLLDRNMATGADNGSPTVRTPRQALRFLRNKWAVAAGTLTVYKEDDATSSWTGTVSTDAAADPVTGNDPA